MKPDWRHGYHEHFQAWLSQLEGEASRSLDRYYSLPNGKRKRPSEMTSSDRLAVARMQSNADMERAINEWNESEVRRNRRNSATGET